MTSSQPRTSTRRFAVMVVWENGRTEYLKEALSGTTALFRTRKLAKDYVNFMKIGMEGECQSINVVPYPSKSR